MRFRVLKVFHITECKYQLTKKGQIDIAMPDINFYKIKKLNN